MLLRWLHIRHFKTRLATLIGGMIAIWLYVIGAYFIEEHASAVIDSRGEALRAIALAASQLLSTAIGERSLEVALLAQSLMLSSNQLDSPAVLEMLQLRKKSHNEYVWMGIGGLQGKVIQATDGILLDESISMRPWFKAGLVGPYASDVHEAVLLAKYLPQLTSNQPLRFIDFASPVKDRNGTVRGVLAAHASWDWITTAIVNQVLNSQANHQLEIMIVDGKGDILYPFEKIGLTSLPEEAIPTDHYQVLRWSDQGEFLTSVVSVQSPRELKLDWQVVVREPAFKAFSAVNHLRYKLIAIGLAAGLVLVLGVYYFAMKESQPIEALAEVASQVLRRDPEVTFPDPRVATSTELAQLCATFHSMTESLLDREQKLSNLNDSLEQQVDQRTHELKLANVKLEELATKDSLTGIANRRYFEERLSAAFHQMKRDSQPYSIVMLDVDFFKKINDTFGHETGDKVLQKLAELLSSSLRNTDLVARYGGEEFIVLLSPSTSKEKAFFVADKICETVERTSFPSAMDITISLGLATASINDDSREDAIRRADAALYKAKENGRNCVVAL